MPEETKKEEIKQEPKAEPVKERKLPPEKKSVLIFTVTGVVAGYASYLLADALFSLLLMIALLFVSMQFVKLALKEKKALKWMLSNGGMIYVFLWFVVWVLFYTMGA